MAPWQRILEAYLVQALLRTPAFHRAVERVAKGVHRIRTGAPSEELGGTNIDQPGASGFSRQFAEEIKTQLGYAERREAAVKDGNASAGGRKSSTTVEEENAEGAWLNVQKKATAVEEENAERAWLNTQKGATNTPKAGFMQEYMDALREQVKSNKPER